eukprot:4764082-Prymnesium_polylepis.3
MRTSRRRPSPSSSASSSSVTSTSIAAAAEPSASASSKDARESRDVRSYDSREAMDIRAAMTYSTACTDRASHTIRQPPAAPCATRNREHTLPWLGGFNTITLFKRASMASFARSPAPRAGWTIAEAA